MLHIKLPKGEVARACLVMVELNKQSNHVLRIEYHHKVEAWRKVMKATDYNAQIVIPVPPFYKPVQKYFAMAIAAKASTGDVYVSHELWAEIRGAM